MKQQFSKKTVSIGKAISNHIIAITQLASKAAALKIVWLKLMNTSGWIFNKEFKFQGFYSWGHSAESLQCRERRENKATLWIYRDKYWNIMDFFLEIRKRGGEKSLWWAEKDQEQCRKASDLTCTPQSRRQELVASFPFLFQPHANHSSKPHRATTPPAFSFFYLFLSLNPFFLHWWNGCCSLSCSS